MTSQKGNEKTFTFHHADLGPMTGILSPEGIVQFKGVPFASIPARFKQSILLDSLPESSRDFTKLSYAAPQIFPDDAAGGGPFPGITGPPLSSEFSCLNLQINVPYSCLTSPPSSLLPVLIYIHGGGFILGRIDAQHDTAPLCVQSIIDSQPTITVGIQYRLGALGFLHTPDPEPGHENRALGDQRNALLWIQKFVKGFGGDPQKCTVFGESAGAISISCHMLSRPPASGPLFCRAILMSGLLGPMVVPISKRDGEQRFEEFLDVLGIKERGQEGLQKLREVDIEKIVDATAVLNETGGLWLPVRDEGFFTKEVVNMTWDQYPDALNACDWVNDMIIGTTGFEGTTQMPRVSSVTPKSFVAGIAESLGDESSGVMCRAYDIEPDMDQNLFITQALRWIGDVIFDAPTHIFARSLSTQTNKKVYRYIFDVRNPFPNHAFYQQAHHWVDVYFVFQTHQFRYPSKTLKHISTKHAQLWLDFANAKAPWTEYKYTGKGDEVIMVADDRDGWVQRSVAENERIMEWSWKRWDGACRYHSCYSHDYYRYW